MVTKFNSMATYIEAYASTHKITAPFGHVVL